MASFVKISGAVSEPSLRSEILTAGRGEVCSVLESVEAIAGEMVHRAIELQDAKCDASLNLAYFAGKIRQALTRKVV